jgi:2-polyprenyl-6-methoxyphenol hydroxylase-like FAD-dependent oxidoreductase
VKNKDPHALIIGGSISGLFAALLLRREGWEVEVFERSHVELTGRGAGIVTHAELRNALAAAGVDPNDNLGVEVSRRRMIDREGRIALESECPQILTSWDRMFRILKNALPSQYYFLAKEFERCEERDRKLIVHFADGCTKEGDLLIGADGIRSNVRSQYLPVAKPVYAGYVAWRGLVAEKEISARTHADLFAYFSFCLPTGEQMLGYPVAGANNEVNAGERSYNWVWYRPADGAMLDKLLTDENGMRHKFSIPPPLVRKQAVQELRATAGRVLAPQFQELISLTPQPFLQPIYDLESSRIAFGRAALIGDAAFVARPHVGAGVTKAAADAVALAAALQACANIETALRNYERARIRIGRRIFERARNLGAYIQPNLRTATEQALAERNRSPEAVMRETAMIDFLDM